MLSYHSRCYQKELICSWLSVDSTLYHRCHHWVSSRAFSITGPQVWNRLPTSVLQMDCVATFKRHLRTRLFMEAYCTSDWSLITLSFLSNFYVFLKIVFVFYIILLCSLFSAAVQYCKSFIVIVIVWLPTFAAFIQLQCLFGQYDIAAFSSV